ncbi:MAG: MarP family serine protease [Candidatus Nanopelagicales bacterium]|nr:MarP family serine protease [Candidatus Nanopelagicales bacterium]
MSVVDWVLVGAVIVFAWAGWRQGFVAGLLSFAGFLGGGIAAALLLPDVIATYFSEGIVRALVLIGAVLICALIGQSLTSILGRMLRAAITWTPVKYIDNTAGAALNVLALAVIVWIIATAIAMLPVSQTTTMVQQSKVVTTLDAIVPNQVRDVFIHLRDVVGQGSLPRVFSSITEVVGPDVKAPRVELTTEAAIARAAQSVVRVSGSTDLCKTTLTGSGFFIAEGVVLTNAHVVAGVNDPQVELGNERWPATVVYFDPRLDVAALQVDSSFIPSLKLQTIPPISGDDAAAIGYPGGTDLKVIPVRIRALIDARGDDIYGKSGVERQVISFRGSVIPGDSGGPLVSTKGEVLGMVFGSGISNKATGYAIAASELTSAMAAGIAGEASVDTGTCVVRD